MDLILKSLVFLPLLSSIINGVFAQKINRNLAALIAGTLMIISAISSLVIFIEAGFFQNTIHIILCQWFAVDAYVINWSIYVDQLTAIMFVLITIVSTIVHIYSVGYMSNDEGLPKFLSYLSLFTFFMLALVSSDNFLQMFFGWEGVGMCSYLLIGYYYLKDSSNEAAIKAFIVNRVSDFAFVIGLVMIALYTGSLEFELVFALAENLSQSSREVSGCNVSVLDVICILLFIGCMGKSAQIGLHVWLPDAMAGPTPVSALIHAATMVTAGVFLLARCSFMFEYCPLVLNFITIIGAVTCLFAAIVAICQTDIKKIIAYSTCSQLGYMFFACGVSAYNAAIFHLITHGFFKALLFLSAGSVIHATHEQDLFKMGGLYRKMPITYIYFWIGSLAIVGIYPFAGFYSKDLIIESAYLDGSQYGGLAFKLGLIAAFFTAIYSLKIIYFAFHGKTKFNETEFNKIHESPMIMNIPLLILAIGAMFSGAGMYYVLDIGDINSYFSGSIYNLESDIHDAHPPEIIIWLPMIVGITGTVIGYIIYAKKINCFLKNSIPGLYILIKNKFYFDELYKLIFVNNLSLMSILSNKIDQNVIDKTGPGGVVCLSRIFSKYISKLHTGYIFNYAVFIVLSVVIYITYVVQFSQISTG